MNENSKVENISATDIRKDAYRCIIKGEAGRDEFIDLYKNLYGPEHAGLIYDDILGCSREKGWTDGQLREYIKHGIVHKDEFPDQTDEEERSDAKNFKDDRDGFIKKYTSKHGPVNAGIIYDYLIELEEKKQSKKAASKKEKKEAQKPGPYGGAIKITKKSNNKKIRKTKHKKRRNFKTKKVYFKR